MLEERVRAVLLAVRGLLARAPDGQLEVVADRGHAQHEGQRRRDVHAGRGVAARVDRVPGRVDGRAEERRQRHERLPGLEDADGPPAERVGDEAAVPVWKSTAEL